jgi:hypothetical protein
VTVAAEDALIAALKVKCERPDALNACQSPTPATRARDGSPFSTRCRRLIERAVPICLAFPQSAVLRLWPRCEMPARQYARWRRRISLGDGAPGDSRRCVRAKSAASSRVRTVTSRASRSGGSNTNSVMPRKLPRDQRSSSRAGSHPNIPQDVLQRHRLALGEGQPEPETAGPVDRWPGCRRVLGLPTERRPPVAVSSRRRCPTHLRGSFWRSELFQQSFDAKGAKFASPPA